MRIIVDHPVGLMPDLKGVSDEDKERLRAFLTVEIEDALSGRSEQEVIWRECLRLYEGVPKHPVVNTPVENAPNIQITLAAIACDSIEAQAIDTIMSMDPLVTIRPTDKGDQKDAAALQAFSNQVARNESDIERSVEDVILDDIQLGSGVYYIPWVESAVKTKAFTIQHKGPRTIALPIEDFITPAGSKGDIQILPWVAARFWLSRAELADRAKLREWDIDDVAAAGSKDWIRTQRENLGRTSDAKERHGDLYEILDVYCQFDIDNDGIEEDLFIVWDRTSRSILFMIYNPYDHRPFEFMVYQKRAHLLNGMGVVEMIKPYQEETTDIHNWRNLNMRLANARIWKYKTGALARGFRIWENRTVELDNPQTDLMPEQMGDIYPSSAQAEAITMGLASRRVGENEQAMTRPSSLLGSRTPATTALAGIQQVNRRFTAAFKGMRRGTSGAIRQCLYRYQERLLAGDEAVAGQIRSMMDPEDAERVIRILRDPNFDNAFLVEITASSSDVNRIADRNDAMLLTQILTQYYSGVLQMMQIQQSPEVAPVIRETAGKIATAAGNVIERILRTFDQIRDPETFLIELNEEIDSGVGELPNAGLAGLTQLLGALGGAEEQGAGGGNAGAA